MLNSVILVAILAVSQGLSSTLPSPSPKCNLKDVDISNCVLTTLNSLRSRQLVGADEKKLVALDPFVVPNFNLVQDSSMANFSVATWNFTIRGMNSFEIKKIKFDPETMTFHTKVQFNPITYDTGYNMKGHIVSIPIEGKGNMDVALGPVDATVEILGKMIKHKDVESYTPTGITVKILIDDMTLHFDGLFDQNRELERVTNEALNINSRLVAKAVTPVYEEISQKAFIQPIKLLAKVVLDNEI